MIIYLNKETECQVSEQDYPALILYNWTLDNRRAWGRYAYRRENHPTEKNSSGRPVRKKIYIHRVITRCPATMVVDHINGDTLDNRRENLRVCTITENQQNTLRTNATGFRGVIYKSTGARKKRWQCRVVLDGTAAYSKYYKTAEEAAQRYDEMALAAFGPFAVVNFARNAPARRSALPDLEDEIPY